MLVGAHSCAGSSEFRLSATPSVMWPISSVIKTRTRRLLIAFLGIFCICSLLLFPCCLLSGLTLFTGLQLAPPTSPTASWLQSVEAACACSGCKLQLAPGLAPRPPRTVPHTLQLPFAFCCLLCSSPRHTSPSAMTSQGS